MPKGSDTAYLTNLHAEFDGHARYVKVCLIAKFFSKQIETLSQNVNTSSISFVILKSRETDRSLYDPMGKHGHFPLQRHFYL